MSDRSLRSPEDVARDFVMRRGEFLDSNLPRKDELRELVRNDPERAERILDRENKAAERLNGASSDYFSIDDKLGLKMEDHDTKDRTGDRCRLHQMLADPALFDRSISGRTVSGEDDRLNSKLGWLSSGFVGGIVNTLVLFLSLVAVSEVASIDLVGTRLGGGVLLGCVATAMFGTELWHRFISHTRPYTERVGDFETGKYVTLVYSVCWVIGLLLSLYVTSQGEPLASAFSGGLIVIAARLGLFLAALVAGVSLLALLFVSPDFGSWNAAYPESGEPQAPIASPVQFCFLAPFFLALWGLLGGAFYSLGPFGPTGIGLAGVASYPFVGLLVAYLLRW